MGQIFIHAIRLTETVTPSATTVTVPVDAGVLSLAGKSASVVTQENIALDAAALTLAAGACAIIGGSVVCNAKRLTLVGEENRLIDVKSEDRTATPRRAD